MATKIVQINEKTASGYDNIVPVLAQNATNATNAIVNSDNTYSGFTQDASDVLKVGSEIVAKKKLIFSTPTEIEVTGTDLTLSENISVGDKLEIEFAPAQIQGVTSTRRSIATVIIRDGFCEVTPIIITGRNTSDTGWTIWQKVLIVSFDNNTPNAIKSYAVQQFNLYSQTSAGLMVDIIKIYKIIE